jgi:AmmeMemoRadiSam system protein B
MVLPQELGPALMLLDGSHSLIAVQAALLVRFGLTVDVGLLQHLVDVLDENYMLENARAAEAEQRALNDYRRRPCRPPMMAGQSYPDDPHRLRRLFDDYLEQVNSSVVGPASARGVVSPHIDYARGGHVYAAIWRQAAQAAQAADLVILLGTDHYGTGDRLTLTRQNYATPYGVLPTNQSIVDAVADAIGPDRAYAGELRNRGEHSLELVATWLHHMREGRPVEMVPVLTGSFAEFFLGEADPAADSILNAFLATLKQQIGGRQVLVVASGDLAHVGPAFGGRPLDARDKAKIRTADDDLLRQMAAGDASGFFSSIKQVRDRNNVCGVAPFYLMLRLLGEVEGSLAAYDQCPADSHDTSLVSVCGMLFG